MTTIKRRTFLGGGAAIGAGLLTGLSPRLANAQSGEITVTAFGGVWEEAVRKCFVAPFEAKTGAKANVSLGGPPQWLAQVEAEPNKPPVDVLIMTPDLALTAAKVDLVDDFTVEKLPNLAKIPQQLTDSVKGKGTLFDYGVSGITYNKDRIKTPPKSFKEFVERVSAGEFVASIPSISYAVTPIMLIWSLAQALGGSAKDVGPFFQAVEKMKDNLVFWGGPNDFFNHLSSGEADIGIYFDGRTWNHYDSGATWIDFINPEEGGALNGVAVQKPKNANPLAWQYINEVLDAGNQTLFAEVMNYGVTNTDVVYSEKLKPRITPWQNTQFPPYEEIALVRNEWVDRWNREIGR
ncbi:MULTISPECIES: extracellular solute-binding protein [Agrobacterium]|uniref:Extracellular solute-binding protein n=1 Tax=Agrobacterium tumefaciens TaxID=358 RepID=A0AAE6EIF8_AGRTU|nr:MULTISPECIES: extracellular solute-binding protein [Agrobacterium]QCL77101.1 extracellular solute-binding protein [Agrobacterium tumefaciens]QCL82610.1 extracellular solute-binding protein [Agrobacterium tumefaciens]CUX70130.1 Twin-arginine translocation pathway signal [Agrobacterium sp. NCPPB 925]